MCEGVKQKVWRQYWPHQDFFLVKGVVRRECVWFCVWGGVEGGGAAERGGGGVESGDGRAWGGEI